MIRAARRPALAVTLAVVVGAALAACTAAPDPTPDRSEPARRADPATRPELRAFYGQKLKWTACGDHQCAELTVPMDYAHPANGKTFVLPVARAVTTGSGGRIGSVIANPGGPGGSGVTSLLEEGMAESFTPKVRARFDIVSFDPRGVGGSSPALTCGGDRESAEPSNGTEPAESAEPSESTEPSKNAEPSESTKPSENAEPSESTKPSENAEPSESTKPSDPSESATAPAADEKAAPATPAADPFFPRTESERAEVLAAAKQEADSCVKAGGGTLRHVGTEDVARDMDVLRAALGESRITYLGWSYGTSLGTAYAEQFPRRVRAMVLDGAVDPSLDWSRRAVSQGVGFRRAVEDYIASCAEVAGDSCPGDTPEEIRGLVEGLFEKTAREPLPVDGDEYGADANTLLGALTTSMYTPEAQWKDLSEALADAERGDGTKLARLAHSEEPAPETETDDSETDGTSGTAPAPDASDDTGTPATPGTSAPSDNSDAALQAVNCFDVPHPRDAQAYWKALPVADKAAGRYGTSSVTSALTCKDWPTTTRKPHRVSADGVPPVLVVGTTGDAATPYEEAASLASQFPGGRLLTYEGFGHTAYGRSNSCVTGHVDSYLIDLRTVPTGTTC